MLLKSRAEANRSAMETFGKQNRKQQGTFQSLIRESVAACMNFPSFSIYFYPPEELRKTPEAAAR